VNSQPRPTTRLLVTPERGNVRLDVFLSSVTSLSRRAARRLIGDGHVHRNGEVIRVQSRTVIFGDVIDVRHPESELGVATAPPRPIEILFEDRHILVASKPAGVLSQPAENQDRERSRAYDQHVLLALAWRDGRRPFLRLVHRLDRTTSGAILFARSPDALPKLSRAWAQHRIERYYLAIIEGHPKADSFSIDLPIGRDRHHRWRFECRDGGKPSRTEIEVLAKLDDSLSVVGCRLVTGRTHQVRVHLASAGHPVLGDRLYGSNRTDLATRPLLHSAALSVPHPDTGEMLRVVCPPPMDITRYLPKHIDFAEL
jgi:23S rRNA pseudouridine1911/1915/1917 synthase